MFSEVCSLPLAPVTSSRCHSTPVTDSIPRQCICNNAYYILADTPVEWLLIKMTATTTEKNIITSQYFFQEMLWVP